MKHVLIILIVFLAGCTRGTVGPYISSARINGDGELEVRKCTTNITEFPMIGIVGESESCDMPVVHK